MPHQPESTMAEFILYNNWANQQVFTACQNLTDSQLATTQPGAYGTILDTIAHIIRAESAYVARLTGHRPEPDFKWDENPSLDNLIAFAHTVADALVNTIDQVSPTHDVKLAWDGQPVAFHARAIFIQIINHGIEHRTNITTILNQEGLAPPEVSGWGYLEAQPQRFDYHNVED